MPICLHSTAHCYTAITALGCDLRPLTLYIHKHLPDLRGGMIPTGVSWASPPKMKPRCGAVHAVCWIGALPRAGGGCSLLQRLHEWRVHAPRRFRAAPGGVLQFCLQLLIDVALSLLPLLIAKSRSPIVPGGPVLGGLEVKGGWPDPPRSRMRERAPVRRSRWKVRSRSSTCQKVWYATLRPAACTQRCQVRCPGLQSPQTTPSLHQAA